MSNFYGTWPIEIFSFYFVSSTMISLLQHNDEDPPLKTPFYRRYLNRRITRRINSRSYHRGCTSSISLTDNYNVTIFCPSRFSGPSRSFFFWWKNSYSTVLLNTIAIRKILKLLPYSSISLMEYPSLDNNMICDHISILNSLFFRTHRALSPSIQIGLKSIEIQNGRYDFI